MDSSCLTFQNFCSLVLMLLWCNEVRVQVGGTFDVIRYGAVADGNTDNIKAFSDACQAGGTMLIPGGRTFRVNMVKFKGRCNGEVAIQADAWFGFYDINGLTISGRGTFDGNGPAAWGTLGSLDHRPIDQPKLIRTI